jgi:thymidylate synthase (FAD)
MQVKIVGYTQPAEEFKDKFTDLKSLVAYCARVSNPSNQINNETADKLINYLVRNLHWSPLEMASVTMEIQTTRDIARQLLRHRSFAFQEYSQRYADPVKDLQFELRDARLQDTKNRQNSITLDPTNDEAFALASEWRKRQLEVIELVKTHYKWAANNGIAKEQARCILPEGNTQSVLQVQGTLRSWIHYISVRTDASTQLEHRELAKAIAEAVATIFKIE